MSTIVWGKFLFTDSVDFQSRQKFGFDMVKFCAEHSFSIDFRNKMGVPYWNDNKKDEVVFTLTDDFFMYTCDRFMEPIYYPTQASSTEASLRADLEKISDLFVNAYQFNFINEIQLFISSGEVNIDEYELFDINLNAFVSLVMRKYIEEKWVPTIQLKIKTIRGRQSGDSSLIDKTCNTGDGTVCD